MVKRRLANGKVIIKDQYGIFSYLTEGVKKVALVGCKDLTMNREDERYYKIIVGEDRPWMPDWHSEYRNNLTRSEAKSIIRHKGKEVRMWEEEHKECSPYYFFAYRKSDNGWVPVQL